MLFLETSPVLPKEGIFVIAGIAFLVILYIILRTVKLKSKPKENAIEIIPEPEEQTAQPELFRPVVFCRTNLRKIGAPEERREEVKTDDSEKAKDQHC